MIRPMASVLRLVVICLRDLFWSRAHLQSEIVILRHQLNVLRRRNPRRVRLRWFDRALFLCLYRLFPALLGSIRIVRPETVIGWHRAGLGLLGAGNLRVRLVAGRSSLSCGLSFNRCAGRILFGARQEFMASS